MVITGKKEGDAPEKEITPLDLDDINLIKAYGRGPYENKIKQIEDDLKKIVKSINSKSGVKESDTGLAPPSMWDLAQDKQTLSSEAPLQVARCTKIMQPKEGEDEVKHLINVRQIAKFVVGLGDTVAPTDIEEGMRVG